MGTPTRLIYFFKIRTSPRVPNSTNNSDTARVRRGEPHAARHSKDTLSR